jgi:hypothetical protein
VWPVYYNSHVLNKTHYTPFTRLWIIYIIPFLQINGPVFGLALLNFRVLSFIKKGTDNTSQATSWKIGATVDTNTHTQTSLYFGVQANLQYVQTCGLRHHRQESRTWSVQWWSPAVLTEHVPQLLWLRVARPLVIFWRHEPTPLPNHTPDRPRSSELGLQQIRWSAHYSVIATCATSTVRPPERISAVVAVLLSRRVALFPVRVYKKPRQGRLSLSAYSTS